MITVEMLMLMIVMVMKKNWTNKLNNTEPDGHHDEDEADGDGSYGDA